MQNDWPLVGVAMAALGVYLFARALSGMHGKWSARLLKTFGFLLVAMGMLAGLSGLGMFVQP